VPGTLVEEFTQEETMEKTVKDLEKTLDLDSFQQVTFKLPIQVGEGTSTATAAETVQQASTTTTATTKGKEVMDVQQETEAEQPNTSKDQSQGQAPLQQSEASQLPVLQTPLNEERGKKRDREETTPPSGSTQQPEAKRQRIDPQAEEEHISEERRQSQSKEGESSQQTATSSFQQEQAMQQSTEVSSSRQQGKQPAGIKGAFMEIKAQNELLRVQLYDQFLKATPSKQQRLMAAYDIKEDKMILTHFKPKVPKPKSAADYTKTNLEVLSKDIHPMDQIELHKQTGEMVYATLADRAMLCQKP